MGRVYFKGTAQIQNALSLSVILVIIWLLKYKTIYVQKKKKKAQLQFLKYTYFFSTEIKIVSEEHMINILTLKDSKSRWE